MPTLCLREHQNAVYGERILSFVVYTVNCRTLTGGIMGCELDPHTDSTHTNKYKCEYTNAEIPMQIHKSRNTNANTQMDNCTVCRFHKAMALWWNYVT